MDLGFQLTNQNVPDIIETTEGTTKSATESNQNDNNEIEISGSNTEPPVLTTKEYVESDHETTTNGINNGNENVDSGFTGPDLSEKDASTEHTHAAGSIIETTANPTPKDNSDTEHDDSSGTAADGIYNGNENVDPGFNGPEEDISTEITQSAETTIETTTNPMPKENSDIEMSDSKTEPSVLPEIVCEKVGRFAYPNSCDKYYFCWDTVNNIYAIFTCPEVFDPQTKRCSKDYGVCKTGPKCEFDKQIWPNPSDVTTFFECTTKSKVPGEEPATVAIKQKCAKLREYDAELGYCKLSSENELLLDDSVESDSEESLDGTSCTTKGVLIDFKKESRYYECVVKSVAKGILKLIRRRCPTLHVFSYDDKKCIPYQ